MLITDRGAPKFLVSKIIVLDCPVVALTMKFRWSRVKGFKLKILLFVPTIIGVAGWYTML